MNWLCRLGIHKWIKWETCKVTTHLIAAGGMVSIEGQKRNCTKCGKKQLRTL